MKTDHAIALLIFVVVLGGIFACGWYMSYRYYNPVEVVEKFARQIDHGDGSSTLAKEPGGRLELAPATTPKGGKAAGTIELVIKPDPVKIPERAEPVECAPVTVRLDLTDHGLDGMRASERIEGGELLDGVHVPASVVYVRKEYNNVLSLARIGDTTIAAYGRKFGPLTIGPAVAVSNGLVTFGGQLQASF